MKLKLTKDMIKGAVAAIILCALAFGIFSAIRWQRQAIRGVTQVDQYIGACQRAGILPTVEMLVKILDEQQAKAKAAVNAPMPVPAPAPEKK